MTSLAKLVTAATAVALLFPSPGLAGQRNDRHWGHSHDRDRDRDRDRGGDTAAGVALGIGLLGIAAAVAAKNKQRADDRRNADWYGYGNSYGNDAFSPARDINCYRVERRCYFRGQFSYEWTDRQFGYDPYRRGY